ncbi:glycosyltransferase [Lacinutrix salivirga]
MSKTCIIIPCYNEEHRLKRQVFIDFQNKNDVFDLCFVNDGSTDATQKVLEHLIHQAKNTSFINLNTNKGKAEAIRTAVLKLNTNYDFIGYLDADLSTPLEEMQRIQSIAIAKNKKIVIGSRVKVLGASIQRKAYRHVFGRMIATFIDDFILKLEIYDTQCGAKLFESKLANELFTLPFKSKWLFDVELFARAKNTYGIDFCKEEILEIPLKQWHDEGDSRITFLDVLKTPFNLLKLYSHYR